MERGFRIQILSGIPDTLSCFPESRFFIFPIPRAKISRKPESGLPYKGENWNRLVQSNQSNPQLKIAMRQTSKKVLND